MTYRNIFFSLAVAFAVVFTASTLLRHQTHDKIQARASSPDAYMEVVTATIMDKQGRPHMKIITPKITHFVEKDTSQFINPELTLYRKSPQPWYVTSKFAQAREGIEHVSFWDDVTIHHAADLASPTTVIKTPKLIVHTKTQTAETNEVITLAQPNIQVKATGMIADMNTGNIKLLSKAQGEYVPD